MIHATVPDHPGISRCLSCSAIADVKVAVGDEDQNQTTSVNFCTECACDMIDAIVDGRAPVRQLVLTAAPEAYDYGCTEHLGTTVNLYPTEMRLVRIDAAHAKYQCARYESGGYPAKIIATS